MWNRRETETSTTNRQTAKRNAQVTVSRKSTPAPAQVGPSHGAGIVNIGQSICIHGELTGSEDMTIEGRVDGKIDLTEHNLTIGPKGRIQAEVKAKAVVVQGEITGNISASEKVELAETSRVSGDIIAPRIIIADGARLKGSVDMSSGQPESPPQASTDRSVAGTAVLAPETSPPIGRRSRPASR